MACAKLAHATQHGAMDGRIQNCIFMQNPMALRKIWYNTIHKREGMHEENTRGIEEN